MAWVQTNSKSALRLMAQEHLVALTTAETLKGAPMQQLVILMQMQLKMMALACNSTDVGYAVVMASQPATAIVKEIKSMNVVFVGATASPQATATVTATNSTP